MMDNIKNIIFDLGGVILTLNLEESIRRFRAAGFSQVEEVLDPYYQRGIFLDLEEGRLEGEEFYKLVRKLAGKHISNEVIDYSLLGFIQETPAYKLEMLEELGKSYNLYLLSNTNFIIMKWALSPQFTEKGKTLDQYFDKIYLSCELGMSKPNPEIFKYLIEDSGIIPSETLFIDDSAANIETGKSLGMHVFQAENGEDFRYLFKEKGRF